MSPSTFAYCRNCHCNEERIKIHRCKGCATIFCDICFLPQGIRQVASQKPGYTDQAEVQVCPNCKGANQGAIKLRRSLVGGGFATWELGGLQPMGIICRQANPNEGVLNRKLDRISAQLNQLDQIHSEGGNVEKMVQKAKDKNDPFRLMGFGHRVYKNFDPRANILRKKANVVLEKLGIDDPLLDIAVRLEETALKDDYFIQRKLFPNVDFYSGIIYRALGIPTDMMTVMFAMGRLSGWIAHWLEMHDQNQPIGRPRQIYTGPNLRQFVPIDQR